MMSLTTEVSSRSGCSRSKARLSIFSHALLSPFFTAYSSRRPRYVLRSAAIRCVSSAVLSIPFTLDPGTYGRPSTPLMHSATSRYWYVPRRAMVSLASARYATDPSAALRMAGSLSSSVCRPVLESAVSRNSQYSSTWAALSFSRNRGTSSTAMPSLLEK